jgi:hypothetical protein
MNRTLQVVLFIGLAIIGYALCFTRAFLPMHEMGHHLWAKQHGVTVISVEWDKVVVETPAGVDPEFFKAGYYAGFETPWIIYVILSLLFNPRADLSVRHPYFITGFFFGVMVGFLVNPQYWNVDFLHITGWNYSDFLAWEVPKFIPCCLHLFFLRFLKLGSWDC